MITLLLAYCLSEPRVAIVEVLVDVQLAVDEKH